MAKKKPTPQEIFDKIWEEAGNEYIKYSGTLRYGQCLWNKAIDLAPEAVEPIRGTNSDCFYKDSNIDAFIKALKKNLKID